MFNDIMADTSKLYEILNYYGLKTNIEESKKWIKKYVADALTGITTDLMANVTYNELVSLRDNNNLKPGMLYRMTDYVTKVYSDDGSISSAEHPFDLILMAINENTLDENASVTLRDGDEYFGECNVEAWEVKYSLDNDVARFKYADTENGMGYIYYMKDEWSNEVPFDFKNILQKDEEYTFGKGMIDFSLNGNEHGIYGNKINVYISQNDKLQYINRIRITEENCFNNNIKPSCQNSYIDFHVSECDISMNDDGELVVFKIQDFVSGIENKPIEHDYAKDYLTFEAVNDDTEIIFKESTNNPDGIKTIEVSKDKINWETKTSSYEGTILATLNAGECLYLKGNNSCYSYYDDDWGENLPNFILPLNYCYLYGNVMSIIDSNSFRTLTEITDDFALYSLFCDYDEIYSGEFILSHPNKKLVLPATTLASNCYGSMFQGCTRLTTAPELPATTLASNCYSFMFRGCTSLTEAPELPATALTNSCYESMFQSCSSLTEAPELPATTLAYGCYRYMFRGCVGLTTAPELPATTLADGCYGYMFNNCTSLTEAPELSATTLAEGCYGGMFAGCTGLTTAPELPATALTNSCYASMFQSCSSLTEAPELPATTLAYGCYRYMFRGCTNLTEAPELPATTLAGECYGYMFLGCTSLTEAPELPATTLASGCYNNMFYGCTNLTTAPELPATTLVTNCYRYMFYNCTSLTTAPALPATTLADYCYDGIFYGCTSLVNAPGLPATTLAIDCYYDMFHGCTSLTEAPELPATTLASGCYMNMFYDCTSLVNAPEVLPATTLATNCYSSMFQGCTNLTYAPELPATTLVTRCYYYMFNGCSSLNYIKCLAASGINQNYSTTNWVSGVANSGTFVKNPSATNWSIGNNGIPTNWDVKYAGIENYITFTALEDNVPISLSRISSNQKLWYSTDDGETWDDFATGITITLGNSGDTCCIAGILNKNNTYDNYTQFNLSNSVSVSGNLNSLWNYSNLEQNLYQYCGYYLFNSCTGLVDASELTLGTSATTLASYCYYWMFNGCASLTEAPELPATTLAGECYGGMFRGCTSLTTAPELPATTLVNYCYSSMFRNCTSLAAAPELPATTLVYGCYEGMFIGCSSLNYIKCLAVSGINQNDSTYVWVRGVQTNSGTFVKYPDATDWPTGGESGIPYRWTVEDAVI